MTALTGSTLDLFLIITKLVCLITAYFPKWKCHGCNCSGEPKAAVVSLSQQCSILLQRRFSFRWRNKDGGRSQLGICQVFSHSLVGYCFISFDERQNQNRVNPLISNCFDSYRAWLIIAMCLFKLKLNRISKLLMHWVCYTCDLREESGHPTLGDFGTKYQRCSHATPSLRPEWLTSDVV